MHEETSAAETGKQMEMKNSAFFNIQATAYLLPLPLQGK